LVGGDTEAKLPRKKEVLVDIGEKELKGERGNFTKKNKGKKRRTDPKKPVSR